METVTLAIAITALVLGFSALWMVSSQSRKVSETRGGDLLDTVRQLDEDLSNVEIAVARMQPLVASLHAQVASVAERLPGALRYAAVVTFDASEERTGHLSRSIALLNERRDGLVITLLVGSRQTLFFTKMIRGGEGTEPLSPEERTAVERALGK
jgi:hypothetical protein